MKKAVQILQPFLKKDTYILFGNLYEANAECIDTYCAFLDTPIVFYRPDFDDKNLIGLDKDDMANAKSKDEMLYNICYNEDTTVACIEKYINNGFVLEEENKRKNAALFNTKENITEKFANYLESL